MRRLALRLAYDGAAFRGFAENPGVHTVAGEIRRALAQVMNYEPTITCAGRTDAGVHARGQVISIDVPDSARYEGPVRLRHSLNGLCGPWISVAEVVEAAPDFDARGSALGRTYRYSVEARRFTDPLLRHSSWHVIRPLDLDLMTSVTNQIVGGHDFSAFCRCKTYTTDDGTFVASRFRRVAAADWVRVEGDPELLRFWITANAFCQQMVRSLVGALVAVGAGKMTPETFSHFLTLSQRSDLVPVAPPHGLVLWNVEYQPDLFSPLGAP